MIKGSILVSLWWNPSTVVVGQTNYEHLVYLTTIPVVIYLLYYYVKIRALLSRRIESQWYYFLER